MTTMNTRKIVKIDEAKCDGCGLCVPSCAEGAIEVVDGKARLLADNLCDGLGNCIGDCPQGAITIEERPAEAFDEVAVEARKASGAEGNATSGGHTGCPGAMLRQLDPADAAPRSPAPGAPATSRLRQWPVQLSLVPPAGAIWQDADVLIAADCVGFALPDFHQRLLAGKTLVIACPKLDDVAPYVAKLTRIFADNPVRSVTVAHMEVPCCGGIGRAVREATAASGRDDLAVTDITVSIDGDIQAVR